MTEEDGIKRKERMLAEMRELNRKKEQELNARGIGITEIGIIQLQVKALRDTILETDDDKLDWEINYQGNLADTFKDMEANLAKMQLQQGIGSNGGSRLLLPPNG